MSVKKPHSKLSYFFVLLKQEQTAFGHATCLRASVRDGLRSCSLQLFVLSPVLLKYLNSTTC